MNLTDQIISTIEHWQKHLLMTSHQDQSCSMADMEHAAQVLGKRIARLSLSHLLEQSSTGYDRSCRSCHCGGKKRFERFSQRTLRTLIGEVTYKRAYYRCRWCRASCFPIDEQIHQSQREISPGVERAVAEQLNKQDELQAASQDLFQTQGPHQPETKPYIVEMDGVQVGLEDGSWQEVKCGVIYALGQRVEISEGRGELLNRQRCAVRGDVAALRARL